MKRNPRKLGWTKAFRRAHGKEMLVDSTLALQQRRNIPIRYNRELVAKTLDAMSRITEIRRRRERQFYKNRMKGNKAAQLEADRKLVAENQHLLPPEYRDQATEAIQEDVEEMDLTVAEQQKMAQDKAKTKVARKQKLLVGGDVEMDVDE